MNFHSLKPEVHKISLPNSEKHQEEVIKYLTSYIKSCFSFFFHHNAVDDDKILQFIVLFPMLRNILRCRDWTLPFPTTPKHWMMLSCIFVFLVERRFFRLVCIEVSWLKHVTYQKSKKKSFTEILSEEINKQNLIQYQLEHNFAQI